MPPPPGASLRRCRSLPALPTSTLVPPRALAGGSDGGIDRFPSAGHPAAPRPEPSTSPGSSETLKRGEEDASVSSCESAEAVCEVDAALPRPASAGDVPRGALEAEPKADGDGPGDESCPRRPDHLRGLASFQRSQSTVASLGLAFPAQSGAAATAAVRRWPSLVDRSAEDWASLAFSPGYEPHYLRAAHAPR